MKKIIVLILVVCTIASCSIALCACGEKGSPETTPQGNGFVKTNGSQLLDGNDNPIGLYGTNVGGWLVQEGWLCPTEVGRSFAQIDLMLTLANRFGKDGMEELLAVYEDSWITEQDFANIKSLGMNCVRIPFTYLNLMDVIQYDATTQEYVRVPFADLQIKDNAFVRLDWAIEMCEKYDLYAILDMHGAVGSQSGNDHTGDISHPEGGQLWLENEIGEACRQKTVDLWVAIAQRYKDNKTVAMYDLINEPGIKNSKGDQVTNTRTHQYFDVLYKAIRNVDANHIVCMEACWMIGNLPNPAAYGWENVVYQQHHYNWASGGLTNAAYYSGLVLMNNLVNHNVPVFIGEFNVWGDSHEDKVNATGKHFTQTEEEAWAGVMQLYCGLGWNFTTWNYKHCAEHSSWGLFNLKSGNSALHRQVDFYNMSKEEIVEIWSMHTADNYVENTSLTNCIKPYIVNFNTNGNDTRMPADLPHYDILEN